MRTQAPFPCNSKNLRGRAALSPTCTCIRLSIAACLDMQADACHVDEMQDADKDGLAILGGSQVHAGAQPCPPGRGACRDVFLESHFQCAICGVHINLQA